MRNIDLDFNGMDVRDIDVNLKLLYYFTVVAEVGNITKAAKELYVTQSMLSKNLILLENQLGFSLFRRSPHKLEITREGRFLYEKWKNLIKTFRNDVQIARELEHIGVDKIRIGCFPALDVLEFMQKYTTRISEKKPGIFIEVLRMNTNRLLEHLISEQADLIFMFVQDIPAGAENYEWKTVMSLPLVALVREEDPLAKQDSLKFSQLMERTILLNNPGGCVSRKEWFLSRCAANHVTPESVVMVNNDLTAELNVRSGHGIAVGVSCVYGKIGPEIREIPVEEEQIDVAGVWMKQTPEELKKFYYDILA